MRRTSATHLLILNFQHMRSGLPYTECLSAGNEIDYKLKGNCKLFHRTRIVKYSKHGKAYCDKSIVAGNVSRFYFIAIGD
jgi:hypothetical protein